MDEERGGGDCGGVGAGGGCAVCVVGGVGGWGGWGGGRAGSQVVAGSRQGEMWEGACGR